MILLSSGLLVLAACSQLAGLEGPDEAPGGSHGSREPGRDVPPDSTLPPAPPTDCGDVANDATNCGYCGHSCRGGTCALGLCSTEVVARSAARIDAFVTDGQDVFTIGAGAARACSAGTPDVWRDILTGETVGQRLVTMPDIGGPFGGGQKPKKGLVGFPALAPTAIALLGDRVFIADDAYKVVAACPAKAACTLIDMGLVDAAWVDGDDDDDDDGPGLGRSLAVAQSTVVWTQGAAIRAAPIPAPGRIERRILERNDATTDKTARVAAAAADVFWLSEKGLHHASGPTVPTEQWFSRTARDFSVDAQRVYLASADGLYRISRSDRSAALAAFGRFEHVAIDAAGVYAAKSDGERTIIVEARADKQLPLAAVDGPVDGLAVAADHVYFLTNAGTGSEIRRVAR